MFLHNQFTCIVHPDLTANIVQFLNAPVILSLNLVNNYYHKFLTDRKLVKFSKWDQRNIRKKELRRAVVDADLDVVQHVFHRSAKGKRTRKRFHTELDQAFKLACENDKLEIAKWLWNQTNQTDLQIRWYLNDIQIIRQCCLYGAIDTLRWILDLIQCEKHNLTKEMANKIFKPFCENINELNITHLLLIEWTLRHIAMYNRSDINMIKYINFMDSLNINLFAINKQQSIGFNFGTSCDYKLVNTASYIIDKCIENKFDCDIYLQCMTSAYCNGLRDIGDRCLLLANKNRDIESSPIVLEHFPDFSLANFILRLCDFKQASIARQMYDLLRDKMINPFDYSILGQTHLSCLFYWDSIEGADVAIEIFKAENIISQTIDYVLDCNWARGPECKFKMLEWYFQFRNGILNAHIRQFIRQHKDIISVTYPSLLEKIDL